MRKKFLCTLFFVLCFHSLIMPASSSAAPGTVKYACEEYAGLLTKLPTTGRLLVPYPEGDRTDLRFYDGVFLSDDDTRILVILDKKGSSLDKFGHTLSVKVYNTAQRAWTDAGTEELGYTQALVPVKADASGLSFIKTDSKALTSTPVEMINYDLINSGRISVLLPDPAEVKKRLFYGGFEVSGLSREPVLNDYSEYISAQRIEKEGKVYDGLVLVNRKQATKEEVLRFGNNPFYLRHSGNIIFDYKDRKNFYFGFYNIPAKERVYYMDGNNMVFRHYEKGISVKEYLNLMRLRAVSKNMKKLLFIADDDAGARLVVIPLEIEALGK